MSGRRDDIAGSFAGSTIGSPNASVQVEELRVSDLLPLDSSATQASRAPNPNLDLVDLPAKTQVGEYEIERKIGEGGMGKVYLAMHPVLGKRAAIKIISDEMSRDANAIARFRREARAVAQLASPHIVDVFGFGELPDGRSYYAMAYLSGRSLRERLDKGRLPLDDALDILDQIARGLEVAHAGGIVHRDLKPENIFVEAGPPPLVKLLDFGLVKLSNQSDGIATTHAGLLFGTPVYISPEQIRSAADVDHRADIYSFGCVAYELILGRVPFTHATVVELIAAHLEREPPPPRSIWPEIPGALDALLRAMLAKDPAKRPTLGHVQETIERLRKSAFAPPSIGAFADMRRPPSSLHPVPATREQPSATESAAGGAFDRSGAQPVSSPWLVAVPARATIAPAPPMPTSARRSARWLIAGVLGAVMAIAIVVAATGSSDAPDPTPQRAATPAPLDAPAQIAPIAVAPLPTPAIDAPQPPPIAPARPPIIAHPMTPTVPPAIPVTPIGPTRVVGPSVPPASPPPRKPIEAPVVPVKPKPPAVPPKPPKLDRDQTVNPFAKKKPT